MISPFGHGLKNGVSTPVQPIQPLPYPIRLNPTDEIEALIGNPPTWIIRWGISVIFMIVAALVAMGFIIKYPDTIEAKVVITTQKPPIRIMALSNGKISQLLINNSETVDSGKVLGVLENTARWQDIIALDNILLTLRSTESPPEESGQALSMVLPDSLQLGNLQPSYTLLLQNWRDYTYFQGQNGSLNKINNLQQQISRIEKLKKSLDNQSLTLSHEVIIAQADLNRNQGLYQQGVVSKTDLEKYSLQYLQMTRQLESLKTQIINNDIQQKQLEGQVLEIGQSKRDNSNSKSLGIDADINRLLGEIKEWKRVYLFVAPISGKISMNRVWSPQQYVNANEEVMAIVPINDNMSTDTKVIGKALLPIAGSGKVKTGQDVQIRLDGFPYQEYGSIEATVKNISLVPQQDNYQVELNFTHELMTTYKKSIPFRQEMQGTARIITEDRTVASRMFDRIVSLFKNR
jgi:multidrug resistance efflux pump